MSRRKQAPGRRRPSGLGIRVIVCGGRDFIDRPLLMQAMDTIDGQYGPVHCVIHGAARGADTLAKFWAQANDRAETGVQAQWSVYGPRAGPIRNGLMLTMGPNMVVAFPGGKGTANMVEQTRRARLPILHVDYTGKITLEKPQQVADRAISGSLDPCQTAPKDHPNKH